MINIPSLPSLSESELEVFFQGDPERLTSQLLAVIQWNAEWYGKEIPPRFVVELEKRSALAKTRNHTARLRKKRKKLHVAISRTNAAIFTQNYNANRAVI